MTKTAAAKKLSDTDLDALDAELTGDPPPVTAEALYLAFTSRRRVHTAQPSFEQLTVDERADWAAVAEVAR